MTSEYDEMSEASYVDFTGGTVVQKRMRDLLRATMEANGYTVYKYEWWHYDFKGWENYGIQNIQFKDIN